MITKDKEVLKETTEVVNKAVEEVKEEMDNTTQKEINLPYENMDKETLGIMVAKIVGFKEYIKPAVQLMREWEEGMDMTRVSISDADKENGSPKAGDMIAVNAKNTDDMWLVAAKFFADNYVEVDEAQLSEKSLANTDSNGAKKNVKDILFWGDGDTFKLISKASSQAEGWMKSTKAMEVGTGVVVQVTTQQRNPNGSYAVAEALTYVPGVAITENYNDKGNVVSRSIHRPY